MKLEALKDHQFAVLLRNFIQKVVTRSRSTHVAGVITKIISLPLSGSHTFDAPFQNKGGQSIMVPVGHAFLILALPSVLGKNGREIHRRPRPHG